MGYGHVRDLLCGLLFRSRGSAHITLHFTLYPIGCGYHRYRHRFRLFFRLFGIVTHTPLPPVGTCHRAAYTGKDFLLVSGTTDDLSFYVKVVWKRLESEARVRADLARLRSVLPLSPLRPRALALAPLPWLGFGGVPFCFLFFPLLPRRS